jgi:membrane protease YdiL (CAAX protease family)
VGGRLSAWRDEAGRVRGGWVVLIFAALAVTIAGGLNVGLFLLGLQEVAPVGDPKLLAFTLPSLLAGAGATWACARLFGGPTNLDEPRPSLRLAQGLGLGVGAVAAACLGPALAGEVTFRPGRWDVTDALLHLVTLAPAAVGEELLLRGLAFLALARSIGPPGAVALSGGLFGLLHLMNPESSLVAAAVIALVGCWFGALAWRSGSLWLPIGLHLAWNFTEGFVFGHPVSGMAPERSLLVPSTGGVPGFWSGGAFGPEASGWTAVVLAVALGITLATPARPRSLT